MQNINSLAPELNAFTLQFDENLLNDIRDSYHQDLEAYLTANENNKLFQGGRRFNQPIESRQGSYYLVSYDTYPLLWITSNNQTTYTIYNHFFKQLGLIEAFKQKIDHKKNLIMYCGFLVIGKQATEPLWHYDYLSNANAYTLITPLFELNNSHGHLLYQHNQKEYTYTYKMGEAIILGDHFLHSTAPYKNSEKLRVLVSVTFGTDKWQYWDLIKESIEEQSNFYRLPCGHFVYTCQCRENIFYRLFHGFLKNKL